MNSHYYETYILPAGYFEIFCDFVLETTKEAIEQKSITAQELQKSRNTKDFARESAKNCKWDCYNADFDKICENLKKAQNLPNNAINANNATNAIIVRIESKPQTLLEKLKDFANVLSERVGEKIGFAYKSQKCENIDWIEAYKRGVSPIKCARFYIRPSWCEPLSKSLESKNLSANTANTANTAQAKNHKNSENSANSAEMIEIVIDPSLAFGSGHHASTFLCLESLHKADLDMGLEGKICLDLGCGSGILGIAMAKMGAKVEVCDIDKYAIEQTQKNFAQNNATYQNASTSTLDTLLAQNPNTTNRYDIICANILADVLLPLRDDFARALKSNTSKQNHFKTNQNLAKTPSLLILSGIIEGKADLIISHFCAKDSPFKLLEKARKDEWVCLNFALLS